jgi:hypothetical protein
MCAAAKCSLGELVERDRREFVLPLYWKMK